MITTIEKFKKIFENAQDEAYYIEFLNKDKNFKKDIKRFKGPNAWQDALDWGRENLDAEKLGKFNSDMIKTDYDARYNEGWFSNLFKKSDNKPQHTPDPIPSDAEWWTPNDIFVFGSNTEGKHGGGAARAAVLYYGAIMGQPRGLQGNSYGIVTLDYTGKEPVTLETISMELDEFIKFALLHKEKTFWMTKIGTGISKIPMEQIINMFKTKNFPKNVKLPIEFT